MDSWKLPLQVRSKYYLREEKLSRQKKGSRTKLLTGMCTVALYWFYIQVSLRVLSGACKCEIGKHHCRSARSYHTGDIKGKAEGMGVGQREGSRKEKSRKVRKVSPRCARTKDTSLGNKLILKFNAHSSRFIAEYTLLFDFINTPSILLPLCFPQAMSSVCNPNS